MTRDEKRLVAINAGIWLLQALYTISPVDLVPDLLPILGWTDDLAGLCVTVLATAYTAWTLWSRRQPSQRTVLEGRYEPLSVEQIREL